MACCPRWSAALKRDIRNKIKSRHINPKRTNKEYILSTRDNYYKGRSDTTFISNFNTSVAEWRAGFYGDEYNKTKKCEFSVSWPYLYCNKTNSFSSSTAASKTAARAAAADEYISAEDDNYLDEGEEEHSEVSHGDEDTDIDPEEVEHLEEDAKMPPKKKSSTPPASAKKLAPSQISQS